MLKKIILANIIIFFFVVIMVFGYFIINTFSSNSSGNQTNLLQKLGDSINSLTPSSTTSTSTDTTSSNTSGKCIVTISGSQYDVTKLRSTHSGGDIFVCGTDMTNSFFSQHNSRLLNNQMSRYKI